MRSQVDGAGTGGTPERLAVRIVREIEEEICDRGWPIGEVLGSETSLRERFGVSRSVLREAVRLLENSRVAQMRQGPGGGLVVSVPDPRPSIRGFVIALEYLGTTVQQLEYARLIFERMAIDRVIGNLTEDTVAELRESARGDNSRPVDFHVEIGRLSGNPVLELFVDVLARLTATYTQRVRTDRDDLAAEDRDAAALHCVIADAMIACDVYSAQCGLRTHLDDTARWLGMHVSPIPGEQTATRPMDPDPGERPTDMKLAMSLSGRIHDDIVEEKHPVGAVLGSEADLVARYGVGRSVFREATRLLEYYGVAAMRRGATGGLVVLPPNPMATVRTVSLYLDYRGVTPDHLPAMRDAIELGLLSRAFAARSGTAPPLDDGPDECGCSRCLRDRIAASSGDPALSLFRSILAYVWDEHGSGRRPSDPCSTPGQTDLDDLAAIRAAIAADDEPLARFRLKEHLDRHSGW